MVIPRQTQSLPSVSSLGFLLALSLCISLQACSRGKKLFNSNCDLNRQFKHIGFKQLIDSLDDYDQQYVEVSGMYEEDKEVSALVNDSLFVDHSTKNALWVNFSQDCPLYLAGTHQGLFEYNDGKFSLMDDRFITIRGMVDLHNKGHLKKYRGSIDRVSQIRL